MVKIVRKIILFGFLFTVPICSFSQGTHDRLPDIWNKVKKDYPGLASKEVRIEAAKLNEKAIVGERLPQIKGQAQNTYATYESTMGAFFPQAGLFNVSGSDQLTGASFSPNTYASATIEWELFSFGKMKNKAKAAQSNTQKINFEKEAYRLELKKEVVLRYISVLYSESQLESNMKNVERLKKLTHITASLSRAGIKSHADSLLASSSYQQALGENEKWKGEKNAAWIRLRELYGNEDLNLLHVHSSFLNPIQTLKENREEQMQSHPSLEVVRYTQEYLQYSGKSQKKASLPSISLLGGYAIRGTGIGADGWVSNKWKDGFSNSANNALIGIGITWNFTDVITQNKRGESQMKEAESVGLFYNKHQQSLEAQLSAIQNKISHQYVEVQKTKQALEQAEQAYSMYFARYESGLMDLSTLLQIQQLLEQAENKHITTAYNYWSLIAVESELINNFDYLFNNL